MSTWKRMEKFWTKGRGSTPRDRRLIPQLIPLEDRLLPSAVQVVGLDKATQAVTVQNSSPDDVLAQAVQELHVAGYNGIDDYLQALGQPSGGLNKNDGLPPPPDTRQQIHPTSYPYRAIGRVTFNHGGNWCTGSMVSPFDFLTAGHCVAPGNGTWYTDFQVSLAQDGSYKPYGTAGWQYERTYTDWLNGGNTADDFGLITLDRNVGSFTGWFGYQWRGNDGDYNGLTVNDAGYPQDKDSGTQMWGTPGGRTDHANSNYVYFKYDVFHGQSGEPDWFYDGTNRYINYITTYLDCGSGNHCGTRINQNKFNDLGSWISDDNAHRQPVDKADLTDYDTWFGTHFSYFSTSVAYQGQAMSAGTVAQNNGTRNAGPFTTRFYIATNPSLTGTNYLLGDARVSGANAYSFNQFSVNGSVPSFVPAGRYYIGWYFDLNNEIPEFDKSNNIGAITSSLLTVLPAAPNLTATPLSSSQIRLNWSGPAPGGTGYKIERFNGSTYVQIATTNSSTFTYTDTGLTANTQYFYRVRATSAVGDGAYSAVVSPRTLAITRFDVTINPGTITAGNSVTVTVTARDSAGNVGDGYRGTVSFTSDDSQASLPGSYAFQAGDHGQRGFSATLRTSGSHFIRATDGSITGSGTVTVLPGPLDHFTISTTATNPDVAGTAFDVTVAAFDHFNNHATNYTGTVTFSSADGGASLPADYTFTTGTGADNGSHTFAGGATLITAGTQDVTATDVATGILMSAFVNVIAAPAVYFQVDAPATADPGVPFDVTVTALDQYGNIDMNYAGTVTWTTTDQDPGVVLPADYTFQPSDAGVVTFSGGVTLMTPGDQDIMATDTTSGINGDTIVTVNGMGPRVSGSGKGLGMALQEAARAESQSVEVTSRPQSRRADRDAMLSGVMAEENVGMQRDRFFAGNHDGFISLAAHRQTGLSEDWFTNAGQEDAWLSI